MYQKKIADKTRCPLEYCLRIMGGKWKFRIICILSVNGMLRYQDIKKELEEISDSVLSLALKEMKEDGLITRKSFDEIPPKVAYSLTDLGKSVIPVMREMCRWSADRYKGSTDDLLAGCQKCEIWRERSHA